MIEKNILETVNRVRGVMEERELVGVLGAVALLKHTDSEALKKLLHQEKDSFRLELEVRKKYITVGNFESYVVDVWSALASLRDNEYRYLLEKLDSYNEKEIFKVASAILSNLKGYVNLEVKSLNKLLVELADVKEEDSILDQTAGIGGTLVETLEYNPKKVVGQEINNELAILANINLLINSKIDNFEVHQGNSLLDATLLDDKYDRVVGVPPFSLRLDDALDDKERFPFGTIPKSSADWGFISNAITSLNDEGKAVLLVIEGALFRSGQEGFVREQILKNDLVEAVVSLPSGVLLNITVPSSILIINKNKEQQRKNKIQFIKVEKDMLESINRREKELSKESIEKIVQVYKNNEEVEGFSKIVELRDIKKSILSANEYIVGDKYIIDGKEIKINLDNFANIETTTLGEIVEINRGYNTTKSNENVNGEYEIVRISDILDSKIEYSNLLKITNPKGAKIEQYSIKKNDILLSIRGQLKVALVEEERDNLLVNANLVRIRVKDSYDAQWLKLYLETPLVRALLERMTKSTIVKQISIADLKELQVPKLSLEEQKNMVELFKKDQAELELKKQQLEKQEQEIKNKLYTMMKIKNMVEEE